MINQPNLTPVPKDQPTKPNPNTKDKPTKQNRKAEG